MYVDCGAVLCLIIIVVSQRTVLFYISLKKKKIPCTEGIRRPFINKERVEKVKMASQQMPSALRLFLDLASALRVFSPLQRDSTACTNASKVEKKTLGRSYALVCNNNVPCYEIRK
uniref:Uncharacterized protein n=1 Tax=Schizaphis graminum TaxID=13262 RepID=A0A2S2NG41_SCHGA